MHSRSPPESARVRIVIVHSQYEPRAFVFRGPKFGFSYVREATGMYYHRIDQSLRITGIRGYTR